MDYISLYPWVCKYGQFPVGHPKVYHKGDKEMPTDMTTIHGLVKCTILPPRNLFHPVLPYRHNKKLTFPLCRSCVEELNQSSCQHTSRKERALTGTWVSLEIEKALDMGYVILEIHAVWDFDEVTQYDPHTKEGGLFSDYIDQFLKLKQEASDWPTWCITEDKRQYIEDYMTNEGVVLDPQRIQPNPGMRQLAKLMLNSFWGKFGQQTNKEKWTYINDPAEYIRMMTDDTKTIMDISFVNEENIALRWKHKTEFATVSTNTNVVIACYTTAQARLHLYSLLEQLGDRALYMDTDSVVYLHEPDAYNPPLGEYLGQLKDELDGDTIKTFVSAGPKNYAYQTAQGETVCKIRGFTLNTRNGKLLNFDTMKRLVTSTKEQQQEIVTVVDPHKIVRQNGTLYTKSQKKDYRLVYDKRIIGPNYVTYPYGWIGIPLKNVSAKRKAEDKEEDVVTKCARH